MDLEEEILAFNVYGKKGFENGKSST